MKHDAVTRLLTTLAHNIGRWGYYEHADVQQRFRKHVASAGKGRKAWTWFIKKHLRLLAPERFAVYPGRGNGEYLVDLIWSHEPARKRKRQPRNRAAWWTYHGLELAAEIEWGPSEDRFWEDFPKLADINARRRLYIGTLQHTLFQQLQDDQGRMTRDVARFLKRHRWFGRNQQVLVAVWSNRRQKREEMYWYLARIFRGDGTSQLVARPSAEPL